MTPLYKVIYSLSAFSPIVIAIWVKLLAESNFQNFHLFVFSLVLLFLLFSFRILRFLNEVREDRPDSVRSCPKIFSKLREIKRKDIDIVPFLLSALPVFLYRDLTDLEIFLPIFIIYLFIFTFYYKIEFSHLHPIIALFGWAAFEAKLENGVTCLVLTKSDTIDTSQERVLAMLSPQRVYILLR